jgi:phosphonate transport system substrate-binding protein
MRLNIIIALIITGAFCFGAYSLHERVKLVQTPGATAVNPIKFYFMPGYNKAAFEKNVPVIKEWMESKTGLHIQPVLADDFVTIVKAFNSQKADIAFMNTLGYMMARDWTRAQAHLRYVYADADSTYQGEIVAKTDGPVQSLRDLSGKTVVFSDPFSAGGYLYPLKLLQDNGVRPKKVVFAKNAVDAVRKVYTGEADAAAAYYNGGLNTSGIPQDARKELLSEHPDVFSKLKIVALTEKIPTRPIAVRENLPVDTKTKLVGSLVEFARAEEGKQALRELYDITGLILAQDSDYDTVQKTLNALGKSSEDLVEGGVSFYRQNIAGLGL